MITRTRRHRWVAATALVALCTTGCTVNWPPDDPPRYTAADGARTVVPDLRTATTLTDEQRTALAGGERLTLDQSQTTALSSALRALDGLTVNQIATLTATDPAAFANAVQLAGGTRVDHTGDADLSLPDAVDTLLTTPPTEPIGLRNEQVRYGWQQVHSASGAVAIPRLDELRALADLLAEGSPDLQVDSGVDRNLIAVAGQLADARADRGDALIAGPAGQPVDAADVHTTLVEVIDVAGRDADAARAAITGTDMPTDYRADAVTVALLSYPWAGDDEPLVTLIGNATSVPEDQQSAPDIDDRKRRANATTSAIVHTLADRRAELTDVPSAGGHPIGELNPAATRTITEAVATRLPALAGTPRQPIDGVEPLADGTALAEAFRVLLTDGRSGLDLVAAIETTERDLAVDFGAHPETPANGAVIGRLGAGLRAAAQDQFLDDGHDAAAETYRAEAPELPDWVAAVEAGTAPLVRADAAASSTTDRYLAILQGILQTNPTIAADPGIAPYLDNGAIRPISDTESAGFEAEVRAWFARTNLPLDVFNRDLYQEIGDQAWHI